MALTLSKRQRILYDRLVTLGDWACKDELPMSVLEIRGFGSFFRGKPDPKDVDLIMRCQINPPRPDFTLFRELIKKSKHSDNTPKEALLQTYDMSTGPRLSNLDYEDDTRRRFSEWIEGFSWRMLYPGTIDEQCAVQGPTHYTAKMIKRHLPRLSVEFVPAYKMDERGWGITCGFTVCVWSECERDIRANLERILSPDVVRENILKEVAYFEVQIPRWRAEANLLLAEVQLLFREPREETPVDPCQWTKQWRERQTSLRPLREHVDAMVVDVARFDREEWGKTPSSYSVGDADQATEMRQQVKRLRVLCSDLEMLGNVITDYVTGHTAPEQPIAEYVRKDVERSPTKASLERRLGQLEEWGIV